MVKVISVRFKMAGKVYFFDPLDFDVKKGQHVVVETARGVEYGLVAGDISEIDEEKLVSPLKPIIRIATPEDDAHDAENQLKKEEAFKICLEKIKKHGLEMKLVDAEYTFDNNKVLFYFTADGRIDFRELVKDLAAVFKTRIELRQIGVRDEIKMMGGIGVCGRVLCCHSYLSEFVPVSIKMAKEQNLSLNPTKISGVCGRLMCCLKNEEETYEDLNRRLPGVGDYVTADDGYRGEVHSVNVLRQKVKVIVDMGDEKEIKEYNADQLHFKKMYHKDKSNLTAEELAELELLEKQELEDKRNKEENSRGPAPVKNPSVVKNALENHIANLESGNDESSFSAKGNRDKKKENHSGRNNRNRNQFRDGRNHADGENKGKGDNRNDVSNRNRGENRAENENRNRNNNRGENGGQGENAGDGARNNRPRHHRHNRGKSGGNGNSEQSS